MNPFVSFHDVCGISFNAQERSQFPGNTEDWAAGGKS
jgi:hypothetical protein